MAGSRRLRAVVKVSICSSRQNHRAPTEIGKEPKRHEHHTFHVLPARCQSRADLDRCKRRQRSDLVIIVIRRYSREGRARPVRPADPAHPVHRRWGGGRGCRWAVVSPPNPPRDQPARLAVRVLGADAHPTCESSRLGAHLPGSAGALLL